MALPVRIQPTFTIEYVNETAREELSAFPAKIRARAYVLLDRMKVEGVNLGMPHTRALGNGLFEVRAKAQEGIGRVMYCTKIGSRIVVLHCFVKKTQKTPARDIEIALARLREFENEAAQNI